MDEVVLSLHAAKRDADWMPRIGIVDALIYAALQSEPADTVLIATAIYPADERGRCAIRRFSVAI